MPSDLTKNVNNIMYIAIIKSGEKFFVMANRDDNSIAVFESVGDGLRSFEDAYNRNHRRGFEASMSACINYIQFQPSIVKVEGLEDVKKRICPDQPRLARLNSIAGIMTVITTREGIEEIWEKGRKPQLITD